MQDSGGPSCADGKDDKKRKNTGGKYFSTKTKSRDEDRKVKDQKKNERNVKNKYQFIR